VPSSAINFHACRILGNFLERSAFVIVSVELKLTPLGGPCVLGEEMWKLCVVLRVSRLVFSIS